MTKISLLLITLLSSLALAGHNLEKTFKVNPNATFSLSSHKGHINIRTHASNEISVKATVYMADDDDTKRSASDDQAALDAVDIVIKDSIAMVRVSVNTDKLNKINALSWKMNTPSVDFEIMVPNGANLEVETHKSTVDIHAPSGTVSIESHKGTGTIEGVRNEFALETHKGEFKVGFAKLAKINIETHKGDITLDLPGGPMHLDARSHKGEFTFHGRKIPVLDDDGEVSAEYTEGNGSNEISLQTHKGHFTVNFKD